ncbi:MAG: hypothetical protein ACI80K_002543 [Paracoccaceae bacterium]|jgi:hypothetical protein
MGAAGSFHSPGRDPVNQRADAFPVPLPPLLMRWIDRALGLAFVCALATPGMLALHHGQKNAERTAEIIRRRPNTTPVAPVSLAALERFPNTFDPWFADAWGGRERALRAHALASMELFGTSPAGFLFFGKARWVFSSALRSMESFTGAAPLSEAELRSWQRSLEDRRRWLQARGIDHIVVLVPHKSSIYPELLPNGLQRARGVSRREQLHVWMAEQSDVVMLDVAPALLAAKPSPGVLEGADTTLSNIYSPHGVHWSAVGAHAGYVAIAEYLHQHHRGPPPRPLDAFNVIKLPNSGDSWASRMLLDGVIHMSDLELRLKTPTLVTHRRAPDSTRKDVLSEHPNKSLPRVLLVHDSFGTDLRPLLELDASAMESRWRGWVEIDAVERLQPDIVIELYSEIVLETRRPYRRTEYLGEDDLRRFKNARVVHEVDLLKPLTFDSKPTQQTATIEDGAAHIVLLHGTSRLQIKPPPGGLPVDLPDGVELLLALDITAQAAGTIGVYPAISLAKMPSDGDIIPLEVGPDLGGPEGPMLIPLLPCPAETSVWLLLPPSVKEVLIHSVEFRLSDGVPRPR